MKQRVCYVLAAASVLILQYVPTSTVNGAREVPWMTGAEKPVIYLINYATQGLCKHNRPLHRTISIIGLYHLYSE
jgi:hypothetical protein